MTNVNPTEHALNDYPVWCIRVSTTCGQQLLWHKDGALHLISKKLGDTWVTHFKPELFDITPDGQFHPADEKPQGMKIARVELVHSDQVS